MGRKKLKSNTLFAAYTKLHIRLAAMLVVVTATSDAGSGGGSSTPQREYRTVNNRRSDTRQQHAYSYRAECPPPPRSENMSPQDVEEETFRCELKKWYQNMSGDANSARKDTRRNAPHYRTQTALPNLADFKSERPFKPGEGYGQDCLYFKRTVRPYPGTCYKPVLLDRKTHAISEDLKKTWEEFFKEIAGDLMYTFDFVLWSEEQDIHDNFWYLILYLKEMAITIDNPMDIVSKKFHDAQMGKIDTKLETANNTLARHSQNLESLEKSLVKLSGQISNYQNIMTTLQNKLNKIISAMPYDQVDQNTLLGKLNYLSMQSILVGGLFNNTVNMQEQPVPKPPPAVELPTDVKHPLYKYNPLEKIISSHLDQSPKYYQPNPLEAEPPPQPAPSGQDLPPQGLPPSPKPLFF